MPPTSPDRGSPAGPLRSADVLGADHAPPLMVDRAFWGITATQFLGAFNDNLFKQTLLLLFVAVPINGTTRDLQSLATFLFSVPFILFSGYAGYLSDRFSKRRVIVFSKVAEIVVMAMGAGLFAIYATGVGLPLWLVGLLAGVLFCMGAQSAYFGPGKYGVLPELFRDSDLPQANGIILMTTFLAIIFGSALAGLLLDVFPDRLWAVGLACIAVAVIGTFTSLLVRRVPAARPGLKFDMGALAIPRDVRQMLVRDRPLLAALVVSSIFWLVAALVQMSVNALGKLQLQVGDTRTSLLVTMVSIGIAAGSLVAGAASKERFNTRVLHTGLWGLVAGLVLMALPGWNRPHLLGYVGSMVTLVVLGFFTGMFAVPLQVFLQARPPAGLKGRMIAAQNLCNWIGITLSAAIYFVVDTMLRWLDWPRSAMFGFTALLLLVVAMFYRPVDVSLQGPIEDVGTGATILG